MSRNSDLYAGMCATPLDCKERTPFRSVPGMLYSPLSGTLRRACPTGGEKYDTADEKSALSDNLPAQPSPKNAYESLKSSFLFRQVDG